MGHGYAEGETSANGAPASGQPPPPTAEIPQSSEFLRTLARRYILDPRTNVSTIRMEPSGYGLVEVTITLKVADTV